MCLLSFRWLDHPTYALILAGNRDEAYQRPTEPAQFWDEDPNLLAGRDLKAGGTWMGITRTGRWAVITNVRDLSRQRPNAPSRGQLVLLPSPAVSSMLGASQGTQFTMSPLGIFARMASTAMRGPPIFT